MTSDRRYIADMLEAIERIERYRVRARAAFEADELIQTWMVHNLQVVGEAASRASAELRAAYVEVEWRRIIAMRNILVHQYQDIDTEVVWSTVEDSVPVLKDALTKIQEQFDAHGG